MWEIIEIRDEMIIFCLMRILVEENIVYWWVVVKILGVIGIDIILFLVDLLFKSDNLIIRSSCVKVLV